MSGQKEKSLFDEVMSHATDLKKWVANLQGPVGESVKFLLETKLLGIGEFLCGDAVLSGLIHELISSEIVSVFELADELGVSRPTVRRWASGKNLPHRAMRPALVRALLELVTKKLVQK